MKVFSSEYLSSLVAEARASTRFRKHRNVHLSYDESVQRLFNAVEPESYIPPHRHVAPSCDEMLLAIRGSFVLLIFDDDGLVVDRVTFSSEAFGTKHAAGVEVAGGTWHTVVAVVPGSVLLEIKEGPFNPAAPKNLAPWAPSEGTPEGLDYFRKSILVALQRT